MVNIIIVTGGNVRTEKAPRLSVAVIMAIVNGWTCEIVAKAPIPTNAERLRAGLDMVPRRDRIVTLEDGKVTSAESASELDYWISESERGA